MKRFLMVFAVIIFVLNGYCQTIKFLNIPMGTPIYEVINSLTKKGFEYYSEMSNKDNFADTYLFSGRFAGENANISVFVTPKSHKMYSVTVRFTDYTYYYDGSGISKELFESKYKMIKEGVGSKYNVLTEPFESSTDSCPYITLWSTEKWRIAVSGFNMSGNNLVLLVQYDDLVLSEESQKEANEDF